MSGAHLMDGALARLASYVGLTLWGAWPAWKLATGRLVPRRENLQRLGLAASAIGAVLGLHAAVLNAFAPLSGETLGARARLANVGELLTSTTYGNVWLGHAAFLVTAGVVAFLQRRGRAPKPWLLMVCGFGALATLVALGHGGEEGFAAVRYGLTVLHFACAWLWLGGLVCLLTERLAPLGEAMRDDGALRKFSRFAFLMMMGVLATGVARSVDVGIEVNWRPALAYALVYVAKVAFVLTLLVMAAHLRRNLQLSLAFDRRLANEMAVALAILTLTALLAQLPSSMPVE